MKFEEEGNIFTFIKCDNCFVYFLLQNDEVVYVGQTAAGLSRPFTHTDKEYDTVKVLICPFEKLDETEDFYICKYKPKYNKLRNYNIVISLKRAKTLIKELYIPDFNMWSLKKVLRKLYIKPFIDEYTNCECITNKQFSELENYIKRS